MRRLLMVLLMLSVAGTAMAALTDNVGSLSPKVTVAPPAFNPDLRIMGDTIGDPFVVGLGSYSGTTVGFNHDYDEVCPYSGSLAPDVVYALTCPPGLLSVAADLCLSSYDTKIFVYDNAWTPGAPLACNDDYYFAAPCYTYSSYVTFPTTAGHTYYVVIDGYGSQSGSYGLVLSDFGIPPVTGACCAPSGACTVTTQALCTGSWQGENTVCVPNPCPPPQPVPCPAGAALEGEPPCGDNYADNFNGGCNSTPVIWSAISPQSAGCANVCGKSCTYSNYGASTRDTDWYLGVAAGGVVTYTLTAEFPAMAALFTGVECSGLVYSYVLTPEYVPGTVSANMAANADVGFFAANQSFSGWPAELGYVMNVCGIAVPPPPPGACCNAAGVCIITTQELCAFVGGIFYGGPCLPTTCDVIPTQSKSWGAVKNLYR